LGSSSEEEQDAGFGEENPRYEEFVVEEDQVTPDMVAIILQLEVAPDLESYTLRYYFSLATTQAKMTEVLQRVKERVKECLAITARSEVLHHVALHGVLPKRVRLQPPGDFAEDKRDPLDDDSVAPPRRKLSENHSVQSHSDLVTGYRERQIERKTPMGDSCILEVLSKKEFEFPELITSSDSYKTSIFFLVRSELVQGGNQIIYLPKLSSMDEFYFLRNGQTLVRMSCTTIEKEPMKLIDPKSSFNDATLGSSVADLPKRLGSTSTSERKEKNVTKMITVSIYATELKGGESEIIYTHTNNLIEKNVLENFRRFIRRMSVMRADSTLAKYFLSEEPREFRFQYPQVNDKTSFLLILKNNLHLLMSRVTGTLDNQPGYMNGLSRYRPNYFLNEHDDNKIILGEPQIDLLSDLLKPGINYSMAPNCTDSVFFFNYNESNANIFGPVLFFLNIVEQDYGFTYYSEFQANDGQYTCLVKQEEEGKLGFDSLSLEGRSLRPRLAVINGIKHVRHAKDAPPIKGVDSLTFHVSSRGPLKPDGLTKVLGKAITNSVIELAIEQWLHSLYFKPGLNWNSVTKEAEIIQHLKTLLSLNLQPPTVVSRKVSHKLQSLNYFKIFVGSLMRSCQRELAGCFKNKESLENIYYFQAPDEDEHDFESLEALEGFLSGEYAFHELGSFSKSPSESSQAESDRSHAQSPTPPVPAGDLAGSLNASKLGDWPSRKHVAYGFDVNKSPAPKTEAFVLAMRLRSPPVADSSPLEQFSKVNAHQAEPKLAHCPHGEELKTQFPVRRFLVCLEVSKSHVHLLTYNVKEEVVAKLFENLVEEITFHEIRETLILGLSSQRTMKALLVNDTREFEARICERYELTQIENHRKLNDREIGLKLTWDYRFSDKDPNRLKTKAEQATITERVFDVLRKTSNSLMLAETRISIGERHKTKQLMDAVYATIGSTHAKMKTESLEVKFLQDPVFLKDAVFGQLVKSGSVSRASEPSHEGSNSQVPGERESRQQGLYLTVPRRSMDDCSELSISLKSRPVRKPKSSSHSPALSALQSTHRLLKHDWSIDLPPLPNLADELPSPTGLEEHRPLKKTKTELFLPSNHSMRSSYEDLEVGPVKPMSFEEPIENFAEQAASNLGLLQKNFAIHVFDSKVRQLFTLSEDLRMDHFDAIKQQRSLYSPVELKVEKKIPLFYFDDESGADLDTEKAIAMMAMDYSEHYLNMFSKNLDLSHLEQKYKLHKICIEESVTCSNSDFLDRAEVEKDPFYLGNQGLFRKLFRESKKHNFEQAKQQSLIWSFLHP
jgi:hypothetical protein